MKTEANQQSKRKRIQISYSWCSSRKVMLHPIMLGKGYPSLFSFLHLFQELLWPLFLYPLFPPSKIKFTFLTTVGVWVLILIYFKVWFKFGTHIRLLTFISGGVFWTLIKWVLTDRQVAMEIAVSAETKALFHTLPLSGKGLWDIFKIV